MKRTLEYGLHDFFTVIFLWFLGILSVAGCVIIGRVIIDRVVIRHFIFVLRWFIQRPHLFNSLIIINVVNIINKINITFNLLYRILFYPPRLSYYYNDPTSNINQIILDNSIVIYILFIFDSIHEQSGGGLLFSMLQ